MAQEKGLAEAEPTADLQGLDMVRKIAILSMICYGCPIDINKIYHYGISKVTREIVEISNLLGYNLKFVASSYKIDYKISICVEPVLLKQNQLLATVEYEYNLVEYCGKSSGIQTMYGKGAGPNTCNSILFDLGLLVNEYKQDFMPSNSYEIVGNKGIKAKYFIQPKGKIDSYFVNKNFKKFIISKDLSSEELQHLMPSILFYARIID